MTIMLICYFIIALIVFAVLDYFCAKDIIPRIDVDVLVFISTLWIFLFVGLVIATPFYVIHKLIKISNKL